MRPILETRKGPRVVGHPLHTALVHFPVAFFASVFPLQAAAVWLGWDFAWQASFVAGAAGLASALPAVIGGLWDLTALSHQPKASALATLHLTAMLGAAGIFAAELFLREGMGPILRPGLYLHLGLGFFGMTLLLWGSWLGGELIFGQGAGVLDPRPQNSGRAVHH
jgi:uncharacterized membrane protein